VIAYHNLGMSLFHQGRSRHGEAAAAFDAAIGLKKDFALAYCGRAAVYYEQFRPRDAEAACKVALGYQPKLPQALHFLGRALHDQGRFADGLASLRRAQELGYPRRDTLIAEYARHCDLDGRLSAVLADKQKPKDAFEMLEFAEVCRYKRLHVAASRLSADAFVADPKLAEDLDKYYRYGAACSAVLAAAGQAEDAQRLTDEVKCMLRGQALGWLRADLVRYGAELAQEDLRARLDYWQAEADFASVRGEVALRNLPEEESRNWRQLWDEVKALSKPSAAPK
jgi:hypothetical protein